eukprot:TRINITY_DN68046_c6_g1_i1.p1 TRINITY_DN68046_c6_g1~~TRINITY_DN68046_c6_g1_i1.p1  ORF type:complete len:448 (-),score=52.83 TRINITY_DN68046_c6_g1_i1:234-1577(-)
MAMVMEEDEYDPVEKEYDPVEKEYDPVEKEYDPAEKPDVHSPNLSRPATDYRPLSALPYEKLAKMTAALNRTTDEKASPARNTGSGGGSPFLTTTTTTKPSPGKGDKPGSGPASPSASGPGASGAGVPATPVQGGGAAGREGEFSPTDLSPEHMAPGMRGPRDDGAGGIPLWQKFLGKGWLWGQANEEEREEEKTAEEEEQLRTWKWERHLEKANTKFHIGTEYNLYHQWYWYPENHPHQPRWYLLRSGLPFPSYHCNPTRNFPPRVTFIKGADDPCEEIRAPRIRLAPNELYEREHFLSALRKKGQETATPPRIKTLNLSYQLLGEEYQYEQLIAFLSVNKGCTTLALTDNFLTDLHGMEMPYLEELFLARNNILSFKDIPAFTKLRRLSIEENFITNTDGLNPKKYPRLRQLTLRWNPIAEDRKYLIKIRKALPDLKILDGAPFY